MITIRLFRLIHPPINVSSRLNFIAKAGVGYQCPFRGSGLHIRSRSKISCFHSGSLQPVAEVWLIMNVGGVLTNFNV